MILNDFNKFKSRYIVCKLSKSTFFQFCLLQFIISVYSKNILKYKLQTIVGINKLIENNYQVRKNCGNYLRF